MPKKKCPLGMKFFEYLSSLDSNELTARIGAERSNAFRENMLDSSKYYPHPSNSGKALQDISERDSKSSMEIQNYIKETLHNHQKI